MEVARLAGRMAGPGSPGCDQLRRCRRARDPVSHVPAVAGCPKLCESAAGFSPPRYAGRTDCRHGGRHESRRQPCLVATAGFIAGSERRCATGCVQRARPGLGIDGIFTAWTAGGGFRAVYRNGPRRDAPCRRRAHRPRDGPCAAVAGAPRRHPRGGRLSYLSPRRTVASHQSGVIPQSCDCHRGRSRHGGTAVPAKHCRAGIAGIDVLWFHREDNDFLPPARWRRDAVAMTSTHDLPTVAGWWSGADVKTRAKLGIVDEKREIKERAQDRRALWDACRKAGVAQGAPPLPDERARAVDSAIAFTARSPANLALIPMEDILGLAEQPNLPGTVDEYPNWRRRLDRPITELLDQPQVREKIGN